MKLTRKLIKKMILAEMAKLPSNKNQFAKMDTSGIYGGTPYKNLTFEKIADIHRFLETAAFNGRHWMFPQGVDHDIYATLNALYVKEIARADADDPSAMQKYAIMVGQIPGADLGSIEEILNA
jgi:hypothetical protein